MSRGIAVITGAGNRGVSGSRRLSGALREQLRRVILGVGGGKVQGVTQVHAT